MSSLLIPPPLQRLTLLQPPLLHKMLLHSNLFLNISKIKLFLKAIFVWTYPLPAYVSKFGFFLKSKKFVREVGL